MQKYLDILERNVQWFALGLGAIFLLWMLVYTTLSGCATNDVPFTHLATDLSSGTLPAFSFITPNLLDDMHNGTVAQGDTWLSNNLPVILNSPEYTSGTTAVFITWDEGKGGSATKCATNKTDVGCHVATLVISPSTVPGSTSCTRRRIPPRAAQMSHSPCWQRQLVCQSIPLRSILALFRRAAG